MDDISFEWNTVVQHIFCGMEVESNGDGRVYIEVAPGVSLVVIRNKIHHHLAIVFSDKSGLSSKAHGIFGK